MLADWQTRDAEKPWTENWWFADAATIEREDFNLSASRYRPESREAAEHRDPRELLAELQRRNGGDPWRYSRRWRRNCGERWRERLANHFVDVAVEARDGWRIGRPTRADYVVYWVSTGISTKRKNFIGGYRLNESRKDSAYLGQADLALFSARSHNALVGKYVDFPMSHSALYWREDSCSRA